ncbi:MAG: hypothetical protein EA369_04085 [Bradymonadales bacterium]|nr:MAG: hypothetical protein EA369_04085 [Bradymonadales bacterium]
MPNLTKIQVLGPLFFLFWVIQFLLPPYWGEAAVHLLALTGFSFLLGRVCLRKALNASLRWIRWGFYSLGFIYLLLILRLSFQEPEILSQRATAQWLSLVQAWVILNAAVLALSSAQWVRLLARLQAHPARFIVSVYTGAAVLCALLLVLPVSLQPGIELGLFDSLFTSVSAISGAGLLTVSLPDHFSFFGLFVILVFIQAGGIGIITFSGILLLFIGRELGVHDKVLQDDTEKLYFLGSLKRFAAFTALFMLVVEVIGVILIYPSMRVLFDDPLVALFHSLFQVVSAICTAGLSSLPQGLLYLNAAPFPLILLGFIAGLGALGAPTIIQLVKYFDYRSKLRKLSAYAKLELCIAGGLLLGGCLLLFLVELGNPFHQNLGSLGLHSLIQSAMRATGFNSMPIEAYSLPGQVSLMSMMLIGGAPISTAGGLKTGTLAVIILSIWAFLRGQQEASFAGRRIPAVLFTKAVSIVFFFAVLGFLGFLGLYLTQSLGAMELLFETFSALAVCGWSLGITSDLDRVGKLIVILLMMIGRIGVLTTIYFFIIRRKRRNYRYAQGEFYVG